MQGVAQVVAACLPPPGRWHSHTWLRGGSGSSSLALDPDSPAAIQRRVCGVAWSGILPACFRSLALGVPTLEPGLPRIQRPSVRLAYSRLADVMDGIQLLAGQNLSAEADNLHHHPLVPIEAVTFSTSIARHSPSILG